MSQIGKDIRLGDRVLVKARVRELEEAEEALYERAVRVWGPTDQMVVWLEELAELAQVICKLYRRGYSAEIRAPLAEEVADVEICLGQLKWFIGLTEEVERVKRRKLARLRDRITQAEKEAKES